MNSMDRVGVTKAPFRTRTLRLPWKIEIGDRFGRWTVTGPVARLARNVKYWPCRCECGRDMDVRQSALRSGKSKGCRSCHVSARSFKHGQRADQQRTSPEYAAWTHLIGRCENANHPSFADYGGRGIKVCPQWRESFVAFLHDMGPRPSPKHSIDRINNAGDYEPGNCRWATWIEQANNKRNTRWLTAQGKTLTVRQWSRLTGVRAGTIMARIERYGWSVDRAVAEPV